MGGTQGQRLGSKDGRRRNSTREAEKSAEMVGREGRGGEATKTQAWQVREEQEWSEKEREVMDGQRWKVMDAQKWEVTRVQSESW